MSDTSVDSLQDFSRVLRLLHSRAKDSADILKAMLDEVLRNRSRQDQKSSAKPLKGIETAVIKSSIDYKRDFSDTKRFDTNFDKYRSESFEYPLASKRQRLDAPQQTSRSTTSSPTPIGAVLQMPPKLSSIQLSSNTVNVIDEYQFTEGPTTTSTGISTITAPTAMRATEEDSEATDIEDETADAGEFAVEMGLACVHCKQIDIAPGNQLVECQECHNLYHQECHKPPLLDLDVSDPRFVWYCAKCQKTMKKIAVKPAKSSAKGPPPAPTAALPVPQSKEYSLPGSKANPKGDSGSESTAPAISRLIQPFKREPKVSMTGQTSTATSAGANSSQSAKPIGLAALANISRSASIGSNSGNNSKSKSGNNGNGNSAGANPSQATSGAGVEKRLQMLKKKSKK
ncbi:unnamed protein product [Oppiella nova]|uniref:Integrator complex subunit 12 n=1 Tax=Oppiella nova TaxID=334625 RepID=A0A7R9QFW2_9ACAR|nr:unnamed protein product [Oppiella nova]CAG2165090.1 unnamed protein product [Oppiella nova]